MVPSSWSVRAVLGAILPEFGVRFPRLERLELDVYGGEPAPPTPPTFRIPFRGLSSVQHLTLKTYNYVLEAIPEGPCLPALRTLAFNDCSDLEKTWVTTLLERLGDQGIEPLLTVTMCQWRKTRRRRRRLLSSENFDSDEDEENEEMDSEDDSEDSEEADDDSEDGDNWEESGRPNGPPQFITAEDMLDLIA